MQENTFSVYLTAVDKPAPAQRQKPLYICLSFRGRYKENLSVGTNHVLCTPSQLSVCLLLASESSDKPKVFNTSKRTDNSQIVKSLVLCPLLRFYQKKSVGHGLSGPPLPTDISFSLFPVSLVCNSVVLFCLFFVISLLGRV